MFIKVHHFLDDASLNFSSSINLINKQANDNFKVNTLAYIANGLNGNENLVTTRTIKFFSITKCLNYFQYKQRKLKNDYYDRIFCSILCKDHNVILATFKF